MSPPPLKLTATKVMGPSASLSIRVNATLVAQKASATSPKNVALEKRIGIKAAHNRVY